MMNSEPGTGKIIRSIWKIVLRNTFSVLVTLLLLFLPAGRLDWWEAWVYIGMVLISSMISSLILDAHNPDLVRERSHAASADNVKGWDKFLVLITSVVGPTAALIIAGLDQRFGWSSDLPDYIQWISLVIIVLGRSLSSWAMITNPFFSSHVRIQTDRGHSVYAGGPYKVIRHPGYAGGLLSWLAAPVFFRSIWMAIPTILVIAASILRTVMEDKTLRVELPGYPEYAGEVEYRLIPGIW